MASGERVALTGPSGSGKSTILGCILGFVQPTEGSVAVEGTVLTPDTVWTIRRRIAYVPQEADLGRGRVCDFMERPFSYSANRSLRGNRLRIPSLFDALGLNHSLMETDVARLSGGEKQRIALVAALLLDRPLLLLDEVTSALDEASASRVTALLVQQQNLTMLGVVHEGMRMPFATREVKVLHDA